MGGREKEMYQTSRSFKVKAFRTEVRLEMEIKTRSEYVGNSKNMIRERPTFISKKKKSTFFLS